MGLFTLKSSTFHDGEAIPVRHTCDGENVHPFFEIRNVPAGAATLAIVCEDLDATSGGLWDHWIIWGIDPRTQYINDAVVPEGAVQGMSSFEKVGYRGPCPPHGAQAHRYRFTLYALDANINLLEGSSKEQFSAAIENHVLGTAELTGTYTRAPEAN